MMQATSTEPEMLQRGGGGGGRSVTNALTDREAPAAAGEPLSEAVADGELRHVAAHGAGRPDPQRHARRAAQTCPLVLVPRAAVVEEWRDANSHEAPRVVGDDQPILEREPHPARAGELVDAEDARPVLRVPQIKLAAGLRETQLGTLDVENKRLVAEILARH